MDHMQLQPYVPPPHPLLRQRVQGLIYIACKCHTHSIWDLRIGHSCLSDNVRELRIRMGWIVRSSFRITADVVEYLLSSD